MKTIYTNLSPINNAYTNINHLFFLKRQNPQKVFLCIWDSFVYESPLFEKSLGARDKKIEKLDENVKFIEKLMTHLKIEYKIIYLSDAISRLFKNSNFFLEYQNILSSLKIEDMIKGLNLPYIPFGDISLSRVNYIISDYLIALHFSELFPELSSHQPTNYLTSERFKIFQDAINSVIKPNLRHSLPQTSFVTNVPVIIHPEERIIPTLEMSFESIKRIVGAYYKRKPHLKEMHDLSEVLYSTQETLIYKNNKIKRDKIDSVLDKLTYKEFIDFISLNLYGYFNAINKITANTSIKKNKKSQFISTYEDFLRKVKSLNNIKLEVLKHCNGNNSSLDISRLTGLNLSTVSTYLGHLKLRKMIDESRRPIRLIDSFVIDLDVIEQ